MRDKLILLLGGVTRDNHKLLDHQCASMHDIIVMEKERNCSLLEQLRAEKEERQRLQEIIFYKFGIISKENESDNLVHDSGPIRTSPRTVRQIMRDMENDDRMRIKGEPA